MHRELAAEFYGHWALVHRRPPERSRLDDRVDAPIRPMNRAPSQEWLTGSSLRPGGGAPRTAVAEPTVSLRPGGPGAAGAGAGARSASASSLRCAALIDRYFIFVGFGNRFLLLTFPDIPA